MVLPSRHSPSPALEGPAVSWSLPLALPSQDRGQGDRAPSSCCACGSRTWLCTSTPRDGPSLTVPCHQGPRPGPRGTAGTEESRGPGRVPGEGKPRPGGVGPLPTPRPNPPQAPGRAGQCGDTQVPAKADPPPLLRAARAAQDGIPFPGAQPWGPGCKSDSEK